MGIGRRDFLKAFGAAIATFATRPLQPVVTGGDYYINRSLGLALRQPPGWTYLSLKEFPDLKHAQVLEDGDISDLLLSGSEPYLVMNRLNPARPGRVGASMTAYAEEFSFEGTESLAQIPQLIATTLAKALKDYELLGQGRVFPISGVDSIEYFSRFQFNTRELSAMARQRSVVTVRGGAIFTFNFFDYPDLGVDGQEDFGSILGSLNFA